MNHPHLAQVFGKLLTHNQAFVFYRLPNTKTVHCFYQKEDTLHLTSDLKVKGFVMSRFQNPLPTAYIPSKYQMQFEYEAQPFKRTPAALLTSAEDKTTYINIVKKTQKAIASGQLKKLVVARNILTEEKADALQLFTHLLSLYPNAMVYFWHHPKAQTWVGATPEQLFSIRSGQLTTMALAGTLPYNEQEQYHWGEKEMTEQRWVRESVQKDLESLFESKEVQCSETFTRRAGHLVHLCNELTVDVQKIEIARLIQKLHPTPAVGGIPVGEGLRFLAANEKLDRAFYAGFLGPVGGEDEIDLYVNLRCAQMVGERLLLYVGAGITSDSVPEKDWEETENKAKTLLAAL